MSTLPSFNAVSLGAVLLNNLLSPATANLVAPSLTSCPTNAVVWTTAQNVSLQICEGTDYAYGGVSLKLVDKVTSARGCIDVCLSTPGCVRAVLDMPRQQCHVKNMKRRNDMLWRIDGNFISITMMKPDGALMDSPLAEAPAATTEPKVNLPTREPAEDPATSGTNKAVLGSWSEVINFPVIPVAAYVVPSFPSPDRVMFFSSWGVDAFGGPSGMTQFASYDLASGQSTHRQITNTKHDMFCPGISTLPDGRVLIQGGSDADAVTAYDPVTDAFTRQANLQIPRGYQSSATLSNGKVFTIGGAYSGARAGKNGEVYDPTTNSWKLLNGAAVKGMLTVDHEGIWREDNHAWLVSWRNASVYQAGPSQETHWYGIKGNGSVAAAGRRDDQAAMCGIFVLYDALNGKILSAGGSTDYTDADASARAHITTLDKPGVPPVIERVDDMAFPRGFANAVVLPDGQVLVTGGMKRSIVFKDVNSNLQPEMFDPATGNWTTLAPAQTPRNYHSVSLLLPDGRVFSAGGGLCWVSKIQGSTANCDKTVDHMNAEILSPPYLFNADGSAAERPVVGVPDQTAIKPGTTLSFAVTPPTGVDVKDCRYSLLRIGTATHSVNTDQRRVPLEEFVIGDDGTVTAKTPADTGVLIPGLYYLFATSPSGTPSVAKTVQVLLGDAEREGTAGLWSST